MEQTVVFQRYELCTADLMVITRTYYLAVPALWFSIQISKNACIVHIRQWAPSFSMLANRFFFVLVFHRGRQSWIGKVSGSLTVAFLHRFRVFQTSGVLHVFPADEIFLPSCDLQERLSP